MSNLTIPKNNNLLENARRLRREMTPHEKHLWYDFLRYYPVKIYKQRIIDNFIADFYCHRARLVIEIDGAQHFTSEGKKHDALRTEIIEKYGIHVLRFSNAQVENSFQDVCFTIDRIIKERINDQL